LVQLDGDGIAGPDRGHFGIATFGRGGDGALATHHIVELGDLPVQVRARRRTWRKDQVIYVSPRAGENRRLQRPPVLHRSFASAHVVHGAKQRTIQAHVHKYGYRVEGRAAAVVAEVESIVSVLHGRHVDVNP